MEAGAPYSNRLVVRAMEYANAFEALDPETNRAHFYPAYHLLALSLELSLKAYLSSHLVPETELRDIGHKAEKTLKRAEALGLPEVLNLRHLATAIDQLNGSSHSLRYPDIFVSLAPAPSDCLAAVRALIVAITPRLQSVYLRQYLRNTAKAAVAKRSGKG